jgi:5-methylcytosine-specific restriction endonuclease McrA
MIPVKPEAKVTLALNAYFQAIGFLTAREALRLLITENAKAIDANGNHVKWGLTKGHDLSWSKRNAGLHDDQPCMRTAKDAWAVPTILVMTNYAQFPKKKQNRTASLRQIYSIYKGVCQFCLKDIPYSKATKDHVIPRSMGGVNNDYNLVLACKPCNNKKGSHYPFYNIRGDEVTSKILSDLDFLAIGDRIKIRPEWRTLGGLMTPTH